MQLSPQPGFGPLAEAAVRGLERRTERRRQIPPRTPAAQHVHNRREHRTSVHRSRPTTLRSRLIRHQPQRQTIHHTRDHLSGGQQQRVAIGSVLTMYPEVLAAPGRCAPRCRLRGHALDDGPGAGGRAAGVRRRCCRGERSPAGRRRVSAVRRFDRGVDRPGYRLRQGRRGQPAPATAPAGAVWPGSAGAAGRQRQVVPRRGYGPRRRNRLAGSLALVAPAWSAYVDVIRVHDVRKRGT